MSNRMIFASVGAIFPAVLMYLLLDGVVMWARVLLTLAYYLLVIAAIRRKTR